MTRSGKDFKYFQKMQGFGNKEYYTYEHPELSTIIPDSEETEDFRQFQQGAKVEEKLSQEE